MSIQSPATIAAYQINILQALSAAGITQLAAGGKARAFCDIAADQLGKMELREFFNLAQTLIPYANGTNLDFLGQMFGVFRLAQQTASSGSTEENFEFYVRSGTFGDINNGQDIEIPANIQITSASGSPVYLTELATLPAASSSQAIGAASDTAGSSGNAAEGTLTLHNFSGYANSVYGSLLVINNFGVVGGRDLEDDQTYAYRINLRLQSQSGVNEAALRFQLLQVPGIQDIVFSPLAGLFYAYIYAVAAQAPNSVVMNCQQVINQTVAYPLSGTALAPDLVGISLATTLLVAGSLSTGDRTTVVQNAVSAAQTYINNLPIDALLVINEIASTIMGSDSRIIDIGQPNKPLGSILIWQARADGTRYSRYLLNDFQPQIGERVVVEVHDGFANAINLTAVS
jgi:uncharacterized phage protein gp47/JayE